MSKQVGSLNSNTEGRVEDLRILLSRGCTIHEAAEALGIKTDSLTAWCRRTGNMKLYNMFPKSPRYHKHQIKEKYGTW